MIFELPDRDSLYKAVCEDDVSYDGLAFVALSSSGNFCRLSCPACKPESDDCEFFSTVVECLDAGFDSCQHCQPLLSAAASDPLITNVLREMQKKPARLWQQADLTAMGLDPAMVRQAFKRQFGISFLQLAGIVRRRHSGVTQAQLLENTEAQQSAGFSSERQFKAALAAMLGCQPSALKNKDAMAAYWLGSPLGDMLVVTDARRLHLLEFHDRKGLPAELRKLQTRFGAICIGCTAVYQEICAELQGYFSGSFSGFSTALALHGSAFTLDVWAQLQKIPVGETRSYQQLARVLARPAASRAVARANGANQLSIVVPCHRVLGADGSLTGYGGGLWRKRWLIEHEKNRLAV